MRVCCGTDIIEISRIQESIENSQWGQTFVDKVFTPKEVEYCESKKGQKYQHYAARFAAKEAAFKAISNHLSGKYSINWKDIEITNDEQGRPQLNLIGIDQSGIENIDISISHCKEYAIANVTLLEK